MINILLISNLPEKTKNIEDILAKLGMQVCTKCDELSILDKISNISFDIVLIDTLIENLDILSVVRKIKLNHNTQNTQILLLTSPEFYNHELMKIVSGIIQEPFSKEIFTSIISSAVRTKNSLDILSQNNIELAKSLYQLDVLYKTSTQLAGSLNKANLILSMIEGVEKTLSFDLSYTLIFNDKQNVDLLINSIYPLTSTLEEAIKLRAVLNYKMLYPEDNDSSGPIFDKIKIKKNIKQAYFQEFDLKVFRFDSLLTEIKSGDDFVGLMEVFRKKNFAQDDATCFQTLSKQVAIPLESASLYQELKETNIKLEKLERLKSEFISIVSHELRTPLTSLKNSLDIILTGKTGELNASMLKFLEMAKRNATRLSGIINDLLDLSKVEAGKMEFRFGKHKINNSIEYVRTALDNLAKEKNIKITTDLCEDINELYIDPQRIEQVLTNLLSNAIKFTPENGEIFINVEKMDGEKIKSKPLIEQNYNLISGSYAVISVKDTGIGIEKDDIAKVFDKFQQIENSLTRKVGGTGLGIPIAKQLVEAHRGFIWVDSEINKGSTFHVALPVLNEQNIFNIDFMNALSIAKSGHSTVGFILIEENKDSKLKIIDKIINNKIDIIKKTELTREIKLQNDEIIEYNAFIPEADEFLLNFINKKLETYLQSLENGEKIQNIRFSNSIYPQDGADIEELKIKTKKKLSE